LKEEATSNKHGLIAEMPADGAIAPTGKSAGKS
jgi:hypothetical protein